ncbi:MAG: hypothetical protein SV375_20730 [Thermodesulfobacteriota bacterium]|nr:hypothetical protein [Thermodesulfobacteriota bacterium]
MRKVVNQRQYHIGIDPGQTGAIGFVSRAHYFVYDYQELKEAIYYLQFVRSMVKSVIIEKQWSPPKNRADKLIENYGIWQGVLKATRLDYKKVAARTWQSAMLKNVPGSSTKDKSLKLAKELFPDLRHKLIRKKDDGRADALLMAEYGRRLF